MIEVYYAPPSTYGRKVLAVLKEKDLDFEIKPMSFATKDHLKEDYLKLNPNGEIPTLIDDGQVIYESTAIIEYLDEEYPEPPLMPKDSYERARVRMIEDFIDLHLYRAVVKCYIKLAVDKTSLTDEDKTRVRGGLHRIETYLGDQQWLVGSFSLADCAFMPVVSSLVALQLFDPQSKTLTAYAERLKKRPGYAGANMLSLS